MPTVPVYGDPKVQQGNTPTPTLLAPDMPNVAAKQTQQMGQALVGAGQQLSKIEQDLMAEANDARVTAAQNKAREARIALTYGNGKDENGFSNTYGEDALKQGEENLLTKYGQKYNQSIEEIRNELSNDAQKTKFDQWNSAEAIDFEGGIIQHVSKEGRNFSIKQNESAIDILKNEIAKNPFDEQLVIKNSEYIKFHIDKLADLSGASDDVRNAEKTKHMSEVHLGYITQAIAKEDPEAAERYMDVVVEKDEMTDDAIVQARNWISDSKFTVEAQNETARLLSEFNGNPIQAEKNIPENIKGKLRDNISLRLKQENQRQQAQKEQTQKAYNDQAYEFVNTGGSVYDIPADVKNNMAPEVLYSLTQQQKRGPAVKSNPDAYKSAINYMANDPDNFAKEDLRAVQHLFTPKDYQGLVEKQQKILKGDSSGKNVVTTSKLINDASSDLKGNRQSMFRLIAAQRIEEEQEIKGQQLSVAEINKIISDLRIKGTIGKDTWYTMPDEVERFDAISQDKGNVFFKKE